MKLNIGFGIFFSFKNIFQLFTRMDGLFLVYGIKMASMLKFHSNVVQWGKMDHSNAWPKLPKENNSSQREVC